MMDVLQALGIVILIVLIGFTLQVFSKRATEDFMLKGFWKGSPSFMEQAELDLCLLYIGESSTLSSKRPGYILMKNAEGLILNHPVEFSFAAGGSLSPSMCKCREYIVKIDWMGEDEPEFFPSEQELFYYPEHGKLVFALEDSIYCVMYKDYTTSDIDYRMPKHLEREDSDEDKGGDEI